MTDLKRIADGLRKGTRQNREPEPYRPHNPMAPEPAASGDWSEQFRQRADDLKRREIAEAEGCDPEDVHPDRVESDTTWADASRGLPDG